MRGLREKKKKEAKAKIVNSARALFLKQGFTNTTTDQIAERAEVSIGTIYNHYRTKEDIFIESLLEFYGKDFSYMEIDSLSGTQNILTTINSFIMLNIKHLLNFDKELLKELMRAGFNSKNPDSPLLVKLMALDKNFLSQIIEIIVSFDKDHSTLSRQKAVLKGEMIFSILGFEMLTYIYEKESDIDLLFNKIEMKIELLFE